MKAPIHWLGEHVDLSALSAAEVAARLNVTGTELDRLIHHGVETPERVVVGRVLTAEQHPDADRLRVCTVEVGAEEPTQIVCGAPNVAAGQTVAVATVGTVMPGGLKIKKATLRGQVSAGMICSARELGIGEEHDGIHALNEVLPGAADRSYGIQVAKLAGLPPSVIARAKSVLAKLEAQDRGSTVRARRPTAAVRRASPPGCRRNGRRRRAAPRAGTPPRRAIP